MEPQFHSVADLAPTQLAALQTLAQAVYPPETSSTWPGRDIEWASAPQCVVIWDEDDRALCHVGVHLREGRWNGRAVRMGGIGGVKTHPNYRGRGLASAAIRRAGECFSEFGNVDFALLVCAETLIPFYERLGWQRFQGELVVTQNGTSVPFTFNVPMTIPVRLQQALGGVIDLMGPPW